MDKSELRPRSMLFNNFKASQEELNQDRLNFNKNLINAAFEELEESILCCVSAGVPINLICVNLPELVFNKSTLGYSYESSFYFIGKI